MKAVVNVPEAEGDGDAMKVDEPFKEEIASRAEEKTLDESLATGISSQDVSQKPKTIVEDADVYMKDSLDEPAASSEDMVSQADDKPSSHLPSHPVVLPSPDEPIKSSIPSMHLGPSSPLPTAPMSRPPVIILAPSISNNTMSFTFDGSPFVGPEQPKTPNSPVIYQHQYNPNYTLPTLKELPQEFNRKVKTKLRRKEKEKEGGKEKENARKEEWFPMGINRWAAAFNANPVWKRVSRPSKCLSSREWAVRPKFLHPFSTLNMSYR
jgi:chromatin modification-related protein VID21